VSELSSVVIVGASLAGHATAQALRRQGFDGRVTLIGAETDRPYDRPPLSKEFLAGTLDEEHLGLEPDGEALGADWVLGVRAVALDPLARTVTLSDGRVVDGSAVVIATGSSARQLAPTVNRSASSSEGSSSEDGAGPRSPEPGTPRQLSGVHTLRTLPDARALKADLLPSARLVVVGAGFIGAEVASTATALGLDVTVVEAMPVPLSRQLGPEMGAAVARLHGQHGARLETGVGVHGLVGRSRVEGVELVDGRVLPADVVLVGVGASPAVEWLRSSGLDLSHGVVCDSHGATNAPGIWAVGDCSAWYDPTVGAPHRVEHWTDSRERPAAMVRAMLHGPEAEHPTLRAPYFWSDQYGVRIQFAGHRLNSDELVIEDGTAEGADLLATWRREGRVVAVLGLNQVRAFTRHRKALGRASLSV
jgi:NADPH-dependent 2,4-dienoyl-CoA reductase/sulfur reductase-like enzyme